MGFTPGSGWICGQCGYCIAPSEDDEEFENVGALWDDEQQRIRSMSRPGGSRASGRRRKYRRVYAPAQPLNDDEETVRLRAAQMKKLPLRLRRRYVQELQRRYGDAQSKVEKSAIIDEMVLLGYNRSRARWRLLHPFQHSTQAIDVNALQRVIGELARRLTGAGVVR